MLELIIMDKFGEYLTSNSHQFGFKKQHSTDLCIFTMKEIINYYNALSSPVYACFIDASKAFDKINHWCLFHKLLNRNMPQIVVRLLMIWYSTQMFSVKWDGFTSEPFYVSNGVRQGGILSPQLFSVYMEDLSNHLIDSQVGCYFNHVCCNHLFYADDAVLLAPTAGSLQTLIDVCHKYSAEHDITYNVKKSLCMAFIPVMYKDLHLPSMFLGNTKLKVTKEHKYLGAFLNSNCMDDIDINRQMRSVYIHGNCIIQKFRMCSNDVKVQLFRSYCYNMYGSPLWSNFTPRVLDKLRVAYNNVFRTFMFIDRRASVSQAFVQRNIHHFNVIFRKSIYGFRTRLLKSENELVSTIIRSPFFIYGSFLNLHWENILFTNRNQM